MSGDTFDDFGYYKGAWDALMKAPVYGLNQSIKQTKLLDLTTWLHQHHLRQCTPYRNICGTPQTTENGFAAGWSSPPYRDLNHLPFLASRIFKNLLLKSIPDNAQFRVATSSGTAGQQPAQIVLDHDTSIRQSKTLVKIMQHCLGPRRLPMLIIDSPEVLRRGDLSARAAGIHALSFMGRAHTYALNPDLTVNHEIVSDFVERFANEAVLVFGFTYLVYLRFVQALAQANHALNLPLARVVHGGGWKKMIAKSVDNTEFKSQLFQWCGIKHVYNFYGMAEQLGSIFLECEKGFLHAPSMAEVIIRDPITFQPVPHRNKGLIQVISAIPTSYPGFSILTEDEGYIEGEDDCACGRLGRYFLVLGRLRGAEARGCSDLVRT